MRKLIAALLSSTALFTSTSAHADSWTGFYGGIFGGYGWGNTDVGYLNDAGSALGLGDPCDGYSSVSANGSWLGVQVSDSWEGPPPPYTYCEYSSESSIGNFKGLSLPGQTDLGSLDADGEIIGANAGINFQTGNWVFGIEAEAGLLGLNETYTAAPSIAVDSVSAAAVLPFGTEITIDGGLFVGLFGKLGYSFGKTMVYGKAGYGAADLGITVNVVNDRFCGGICWSATTDDMTEALMYGVGVEHMIANGLSLKLEYVRMDFDETELIVQNFADWDYYEFDTSVDTVKIGLNFQLGTPD